MFMRMERIEQECDELKFKLNKYESRTGNELKEIKNNENSLNVIKNMKSDLGLEIDNKKEINKITVTSKKNDNVDLTNNISKPSALVNIY